MFYVKKLHVKYSEKIEILEKYVSEKIKKEFKFHTDDKEAVKNLLITIKMKWKECNRTAERFFKNNSEWIKKTIKLKVKVIISIFRK